MITYRISSPSYFFPFVFDAGGGVFLAGAAGFGAGTVRLGSVTVAGGFGNAGCVGTVGGGGCFTVVEEVGFRSDEGSSGAGAVDFLARGGWDGIVGFVGIVAGGRI